MSLYKKLTKSRILNRVLVERLTEPIHLNLLSVFVGIFGGIKSRIKYDLVFRQHNAYGLDFACREAVKNNIQSFTAIEFGVASGAGLTNMYHLAKRLEKAYGVKINLIGFDSGEGLPQPSDYRDHPDIYHKGDYPMAYQPLRDHLPKNVRIVLGDVRETVIPALQHITKESPVGYIAFDLDYYSSTKSALEILKAEQPEKFLPIFSIYLDDIYSYYHHDYAGVYLAVREFNEEMKYRKISKFRFLDIHRIFKNAQWLKQMRFVHIMDHPRRMNGSQLENVNIIENNYIKFAGNKERFAK